MALHASHPSTLVQPLSVIRLHIAHLGSRYRELELLLPQVSGLPYTSIEIYCSELASCFGFGQVLMPKS
jgi:hypothetical protein